MRHFDVQLIGGMVLHEGKIAEMATGEGKTLVATLPAYLNALSGRGRARHHGQRLPGQARHAVDGAGLPRAGSQRGRPPARGLLPVRSHGADVRPAAGEPASLHAPRGLPGRYHLRDQQRVRVRLPPRQHEIRGRGLRPARPELRHRGRGGQHPDRRGPHAADHLRPLGGVHRQVLRHRPDHPPPEAGGHHHAGSSTRSRRPPRATTSWTRRPRRSP